MPPHDVIRLRGDEPKLPPLLTRCISDIEAQPVRWLWPRRIASGKVTVVAGHPGLGKSQLALDVAATVSAGRSFPGDNSRSERGSVIILSAEDDAADTIRPRLEASGAGLSHCHVIEAAQDRGAGGKPKRRSFSLVKDLDRLEAELRNIGDVVLVIIDPITAYLGEIDSHRNAEVRSVLAPLADLAARHGVAVLAVSHLRKTVSGDAVLQVTGSLAFAAAARTVYIVARDPSDPARRLFLPAKNNVGEDRTGYAFRIEPVSLTSGIDTCRIAWEPDVVTISADEALAGRQHGTSAGKLAAATRWLEDMLADRPVPQKLLEAEATKAGHGWATVRRAQRKVGITSTKTGYGQGWVWQLPAAQPETEIVL
jgi:putative DNA primase/helicase